MESVFVANVEKQIRKTSGERPVVDVESKYGTNALWTNVRFCVATTFPFIDDNGLRVFF